MNQPNIAICIATYKRPVLLRELLVSIQNTLLPEGSTVSIRIVDNDDNQSAADTVENFAQQNTKFQKIDYLTEPRQNIAYARNRAVDLGHADVFIFVDDDETVHDDWLVQLWNTYQTHQPAALFGPVKEKLITSSDQDWKQHFFSKSTPETGTHLTWQSTRTSNTLVDGKVFYANEPLRFDPSFGVSGGSDSHLFARLQQQGGVLMSCQEAVVEEVVPAERATFQWLCKRWYRNGLIYERISKDYNSEMGGIFRFSKRIIKSILLCAKGIFHFKKTINIHFHEAAFETCLAWGGLVAWMRPQSSSAYVAYTKEIPVKN